MAIVSVENAEHYVWGGACDGWHLLRTPDLSVIQERVPPGAAEARHYHEKARQFFYVLSGQATLELADKKITLGPGQGLAVPPLAPHRLLNQGEQDLQFLVVSAPMSHGDKILVD